MTRAANNRKHMTGERFTRLIVLGPDRRVGKTLYWLCLCDCGNTRSVLGGNLRSYRTKSCGCLSRERSRQNGAHFITHGMTGTPEYMAWHGMLQRCNNPKNHKFELYGGRGIVVCDRWKRFINFYADMGQRPDGLTLERKDSNGNYCPKNCKWATRSEQNLSRRPYKWKRNRQNEQQINAA